jgi:hypothetical protein
LPWLSPDIALTNKAGKDVLFLIGDKDAQTQPFRNVSHDLLKLRDDINKILDRRANELRSQLSMLGHAPAASLKGPKVPAKYRSCVSARQCQCTLPIR